MAGALVMLVVVGFFMLFGLACLAFWIWMLVDCVSREFSGENEKVVWVLVIVLTGAIGALIYLIVGRPKGIKPGPPRGGLPVRSG